MAYKINQPTSIRTRLRQVSLVSAIVFMLIALSIYFSFVGVQKKIDQIVEKSLQQIIVNSNNSREFGLLNTRLSVFQKTFYADSELLETEGEAIRQKLGVLQTAVQDSPLADFLGHLQGQFSTYLKQCEWINYLLLWRSGQDKDINELLLFMQDIIAEKTIVVTLEGGDVDYLEQLILLISGYRESLLEIAKLNAEENRSDLLSASIDAPFPLQFELNDLALRLRTLTASEPPIDRLGQHLISRLSHYQFLMHQYRKEMVRLGEMNRQLQQSTMQILLTMDHLNNQAATAAIESRTEIKKFTNLAIIITLGLLSFLAGVFWVFHRNLFKKHIQAPMDIVSKRLEQFHQGDHISPIRLDRHDEWKQVEVVFNKMVATLEESFSALTASEQRYRDIFNNSTEGIFQATVAGEILNSNPALAEIFGYSFNNDVELQTIMATLNINKDIYFRAEDRDRWFSLVQQHGRASDFKVQMVRKDGSVFWAEVSGHVICDSAGHIIRIEGTVRDISARKIAEEGLYQLQVYLQNIIDSMPSILIGVNINMEVTLWNKRAEEESVLTAEEANGLSMTKVCRLFDSSAYMSKLKETLKTRKPTRLRRVESIKKGKNGSSRFFDILIYPLSLTEESGAVIHMDDVTERLHLEKMMIRSERMQSVGGLAAGLAHEINNPLAVILQNAQVLNRRLSPSLERNQQTAQELGTTIEVIAEYTRLRGCEKMLHSISDAGQRAAKIVENIQSFSRRGVSPHLPCSMTDLLERTVEFAGSDDDMRHQFDFKKVRIVRNLHPVPDVCCESSQIQQVILSLLKNAAQTLTQNTAAPQITLRLLPFGKNHVCLQVEDNGTGMEPDVVERIFDPFYTTQAVGKGIGLGLSIAYFMVVHNHNGRLSVTSTPGQGSCFEMVLPLTNTVPVGEVQ